VLLNNKGHCWLDSITEGRYLLNPIYKGGKEINPIPKDRKVTVWCEGTNEGGFACNVTADEMGLEALIAKSWIYEDELQTMCGG